MRYKCDVCEWIFDEEKEGIKFEDLADDWTCPICGAANDMFSKIDVSVSKYYGGCVFLNYHIARCYFLNIMAIFCLFVFYRKREWIK